MKKVGIREVAQEANVSTATVSRVLNNRGYISQETRDKVQAAMKKLEYYPNDLARALYKKRTYTVGLIFPSNVHPFQAELIQDIEYLLSNQGYKVLLCNSLNNPEKEIAYLTMLKKNQVDGIIVGTHNKHIDGYKNTKLPVIAIDRDLGKNTATVSCDNYAGGQMAVQLLIDRGCKQILDIRGDSSIKLPANERTVAYRDLMKKYGLESHVLEVPFVLAADQKRQIIEDYLGSHPQIDGIFAGDDLLASLAIFYLETHHKKVPDDVKVIGFDGAKETLLYNPRLTTIRQPIEQIARTATEKLINEINGQKETDQLKLPVTLFTGHTV
ncbi:MAG: LacI family DNA-binding transcriptional regulator [Lactobacillus panisapium]|uniref:LacI family DNA-binding transcriptional regulator n=1 Tax=Lactobacillus TaxID=1578 RepID=UPI001C698D92|nr:MULTISPECIES: LacI family DNA-binding transcriptional regulator [Lactobacillus]MCX8736370.1 LacI family DNA-binding transcriptional regulator [Lactobacillus sp. B4026]QYN57878.1 LacI family transcriptional regulator [Lactobacillus panisapium]